MTPPHVYRDHWGFDAPARTQDTIRALSLISFQYVCLFFPMKNPLQVNCKGAYSLLST